MKKLIMLAAALAAASVPMTVHAAKKPTPDQLCAVKGSLAAVVMRMRQMGQRMSDQIEMVSTAPGGSREMVIRAYKHPRFSTPEMQEQAVQDFRNEIELECFNG